MSISTHDVRHRYAEFPYVADDIEDTYDAEGEAFDAWLIEVRRQEAERVWEELKSVGLLAHPVSNINPYRK